jgi:hypothetical protein
LPLTRKRAALLAHLQNTHSQYTLPESGQTLAYKGNRDGVAARFPAPAAQKSVAVALALLDHDARLHSDVELTSVQTAKQPQAQALYRRPSVLGIGKILRLGLLSAMQDITRFPRVQDFVSYCRLVTCAKAAAGQRDGTPGAKSGHAYLPWAFSEAALLFLRNPPAGQQSLARFETNHGKGQAWTV